MTRRGAGLVWSLLLGVLSSTATPLAAQQVRYYHLDAIGSVRAISDAGGTVVERHDYLPFGEECTTGTCSLNPGLGVGVPRKFTGKERDVETGLDYFGARYYGSKIARFTNVDPAHTIAENLVDPQRWNRYAYARNNPLRFIDPDGRTTIVVHGTWANNATWAQHGSDFSVAVSATFGEPAVAFNWSGGNSTAARAQAAAELADFIAANRQEGEPLNIVAHSHGGNVVKAYTQLPGAQQIDTLVNLGTPQRPDYVIKDGGAKQYINVFSKNDSIQTSGGEGRAAGQAFRTDVGAQNREVSRVDGRKVGHTDLHTPPVWREVEKDIKR